MAFLFLSNEFIFPCQYLSTLSYQTQFNDNFNFIMYNEKHSVRADPKVLNFKKVYMITHRRSGLLISKYVL